MSNLVRRFLANAWLGAKLLALVLAIKLVFMPLARLANALPGGD